jgi:hypothetical protein
MTVPRHDPILLKEAMHGQRFPACIDVLYGAVQESDVLMCIQDVDRSAEIARPKLVVGMEQDHVATACELDAAVPVSCET